MPETPRKRVENDTHHQAQSRVSSSSRNDCRCPGSSSAIMRFPANRSMWCFSSATSHRRRFQRLALILPLPDRVPGRAARERVHAGRELDIVERLQLPRRQGTLDFVAGLRHKLIAPLTELLAPRGPSVGLQAAHRFAEIRGSPAIYPSSLRDLHHLAGTEVQRLSDGARSALCTGSPAIARQIARAPRRQPRSSGAAKDSSASATAPPCSSRVSMSAPVCSERSAA